MFLALLISIFLTHLPLSRFYIGFFNVIARHSATQGDGWAQYLRGDWFRNYKYLCRALVQDTIFSKAISAFNFILTRVPVILESKCAPTIIPVAARQCTPLHPLHEMDVQAHPNEELDHCRHQNTLVLIPPPFPVSEYLERYTTFLDVRRSHQMWSDDNLLQGGDHLSARPVMAVAYVSVVGVFGSARML